MPDSTEPNLPRVSAVICTRNREDKIAHAVASVLACDYPAFDLTVIDQSTTPATREALTALLASDSRVRYFHSDESGLSRAYNTAIRSTTGEILAFTDDDCLVPGDWIRKIVAAFESDGEADLLYGKVVAAGSEVDDVMLTPAFDIEQPHRMSRRDGFKIGGMGANFAARRRLFDQIGGFDEVLGGGGPLKSSQDFDLAYRAFRAGSVIVMRPEVWLRHDGRREREDWSALLLNYGIGDGAFYWKHVRCGDWYAMSLLARRVAGIGSKYLVKVALGRKPDPAYLQGMLGGIRQSLHFGVDRHAKIYCNT
jgi:glycosyltransferase involved in cell wall biosynthesis